MASSEPIPDHLKGDFTLLLEMLRRMDEQKAARVIAIAARANPFLYQRLKEVLPL